jgi:hypothetical protein
VNGLTDDRWVNGLTDDGGVKGRPLGDRATAG